MALSHDTIVFIVAIVLKNLMIFLPPIVLILKVHALVCQPLHSNQCWFSHFLAIFTFMDKVQVFLESYIDY